MLRDDIKAATVTAMKAKEKQRTATLRLIGAKIKDRDIELRGGKAEKSDDDLVIGVLKKMAKQRNELITMYVDGGREELAEQERAEQSVIEEFLPQMMDEAQMRTAIAEAVEKTGAASIKDMGKVMGALTAQHGAKIDMSKAGPLVKEKLA